MGVQEAAKYGGVGFLIDRFFNTGFLGTLAGAAYGGLFKPDAGEMNAAYDKRKATVNQTLKDFLGFDMTDILSGTAAKQGTTAEGVKPSRERAKQAAAAREKKDGFPWGKVALGVGAAFLGVNLLDNMATMTMPFSSPLYAPYMPYGSPWGGGIFRGGGGILPMAAMALLGLGRGGFIC